MTKKRHSKDKLYLNPKELIENWGGYKEKQVAHFQALPFYCCGLSLSPFENPVCTREGIIFDIDNIVPYVKKYNKNPVSGNALKISELIPIKFHKNHEDQFHCPITFKVFNNNTHIVANSKSGNVYCNEAIENLCRKAKNWTDLITSEPFSSSDLITIQDPHSVLGRKIEDFDYIKKGLKPTISQEQIKDEDRPFIKKNPLSQRILNKANNPDFDLLKKHRKVMKISNTTTDSFKPTPLHEVFTTHKLAASFTSTILEPSSKSEFRELTSMEIMNDYYQWVKKNKKKGYVRMTTNKGILNIELHCDLVPRTCDNFLRHCQSNYYIGACFHRLIANFMIQGGEKADSENGGQSAFEDSKPFEDEFHPQLVHKGLGILSMANKGKNTNTSQFFFTFKSCEHLNNKNTIFGRVVGGLEVLKSWEKLEVTKNFRPKEPLIITSTQIFLNPFDLARESISKETETDNLSKEINKKSNKPPAPIYFEEYIDIPKTIKSSTKNFNFSSW